MTSSTKSKKRFQIIKLFHYFLIISFAIPISCEFSSKDDESPVKNSVIKYILKDSTDQALNNLKALNKVGMYFENSNYSMVNPHDGYISLIVDSMTLNTFALFNPKIDFAKAKELNYLLDDPEHGTIIDYKIQFQFDKENKIVSNTSIIEYSKSGIRIFEKTKTPDLSKLFNTNLIQSQKVIKAEKDNENIDQIKLSDEIEKMDQSDFWNTFDPDVKTRIYFLVLKKDCAGLQNEFDIAANMMKTRQELGKSGMNHLSLISFLEKKIKEFRCS